MSTAVETLKTVLAELTVEERSELARFLVDSIDPEGSTDVEDGWDSELARRGDEIRGGKASGKTSRVGLRSASREAPVKPVLFHAATEAELHDAIAFYESRRAGLGPSFQSEVEHEL